MLRNFARKLAATDYVSSAIADQADLSAFQEKPTPRIVMGLCIIGLSYIIGWPVITGLAAISLYLKEPMIVGIGGPVMYGISHLTFMVGAYFAGAHYTLAIMRWLTRISFEQLLCKEHLAQIRSNPRKRSDTLPDHHLR